MDMQEIEVYIEKDGQVKVAVHGVKGMSCLDLTAALEQALGNEIEDREMTPESQEVVAEAVQDWQKQGY